MSIQVSTIFILHLLTFSLQQQRDSYFALHPSQSHLHLHLTSAVPCRPSAPPSRPRVSRRHVSSLQRLRLQPPGVTPQLSYPDHLLQPTLSFRNRRSTTTGKAKGAVAATATVHRVDSAASLSSSIDAEEPAVKVNKKKVEKKKEAAITVADDTREVLDSNSKEWNGLYEDAKVEMGGLKPGE